MEVVGLVPTKLHIAQIHKILETVPYSALENFLLIKWWGKSWVEFPFPDNHHSHLYLLPASLTWRNDKNRICRKIISDGLDHSWFTSWPYTQRTRRHWRKRPSIPDWQDAGWINMGSYFSGWSQALQAELVSGLPARISKVYRGPKRVQPPFQGRWSQQNPPLSRVPSSEWLPLQERWLQCIFQGLGRDKEVPLPGGSSRWIHLSRTLQDLLPTTKHDL